MIGRNERLSMSDDLQLTYPNARVEILHLQSLTPGKRTQESVTRLEALIVQEREADTKLLRQQYDLAKLRTLLPDTDQCYETLRELASRGIRLPEDYSILVVQAPRLRVQLVNLQANVNVYYMAANVALKRINLVVDRCEAYWTSYAETTAERKQEFRLAAADLLDLQTDCDVIAGDCERTYWMCSQMLEQLDRSVG